MNIKFGLDFGTSNSALSVNRDGRDGTVEVIDIDPRNLARKTLRSVLYFDTEGKCFTGQEAIDHYIANGAVGRFMQSIKSFLPSQTFEFTRISGKRYTLEDLIAIILRIMKERGENYLRAEVPSVVMGRPVVFSEDQKADSLAQERLKNAAQLAGFKNIEFQLEPIAAALTFEKSLPYGEESIVLIGDFGGGTSDFCVMKLTGGSKKDGLDRKEDILALGGVYIGGDTFDSEIMWQKVADYFGKNIQYESMPGKWQEMPREISWKLRQWHLMPQLREKRTRDFIGRVKKICDNPELVENLEHLVDDNYGFMLFQSIEKAKIDLSEFPASAIAFEEGDLRIKNAISRFEFEQMLDQYIKKIDSCIDDMLGKAGVAGKNIEQIFLMGGSSYIPRIRKIFIDQFGGDKLKFKDAFTSVAYGLAI